MNNFGPLATEKNKLITALECSKDRLLVEGNFLGDPSRTGSASHSVPGTGKV
jgi:hypothetical protein